MIQQKQKTLIYYIFRITLARPKNEDLLTETESIISSHPRKLNPIVIFVTDLKIVILNGGFTEYIYMCMITYETMCNIQKE